jgi:hypothetical protein
VEHNANRNFSDDSSDQIKFGDMGCTNVLSVFCWDTNLADTEIQGKLKNFNSNTIEGTEISVDGAAAELSEILFSAAKSS